MPRLHLVFSLILILSLMLTPSGAQAFDERTGRGILLIANKGDRSVSIVEQNQAGRSRLSRKAAPPGMSWRLLPMVALRMFLFTVIRAWANQGVTAATLS